MRPLCAALYNMLNIVPKYNLIWSIGVDQETTHYHGHVMKKGRFEIGGVMSESRTKKTLRNTMFSFVYQISDVLLNFILRTIFIHTLGKTYLGLSGLFANILTVLSLMDLGVGGAIVFCLYKPLSEHDDGKVNALMQLYKKVYTCIGVLVCLAGAALTPFLNIIVHLPDTVEHLYVIYWLSIGNTAISYFLAYRRSLLMADQRTDINIKNQMVFRLSRFILLSAALLFTHNYLLYLMLDILNTFASNVHITLLIKRIYVHVENAPPTPITKQEQKQIIQYMSSGILSKFGQTIVNCTDNIIISAFVGTIMVGLYSNYSMIISSLDVAVYLVFSGITASIGNFAVEKNGEQSEELFRKITFGNYLIVFYLTICLTALLNPFIAIWAGKDYLLSNWTVFVILLNFYISALQKSVECFMGANGPMYYHNRYRSLVEGIVNLATSLIFVKFSNLGITGVFLGTTVCFLVGRIWMDAFVLYRYWFCKPFAEYARRYLAQMLLTMCTAVLGRMATGLILAKMGVNIFSWILCGVLLTLAVGILIVLLFRNKEEFVFYKKLVLKNILKL